MSLTEKYEEIMSRVRSICGTSVEDAKIDIQNEKSAAVLFVCIEHETQHLNRSSMLRNLRSRIRKVEKY